MRRCLALSVVLLGLLLAGLAIAILGRHEDQGPVYSVAQVQARLERQPDRWLGLPVRLRAVAEPCPMWGSASMGMHCLSSQPVLVDQANSLADSLPLTWRQQSSLLAFLRGIPLVGELLPAPRMANWAAPATYRVQFRAAPATSCGYSPCYRALLLDAAPDAPGER
jgi:hypothetical protein